MTDFSNTFKNIDDILWKDTGCDNAIDYIKQTSWILFLKYLHDFEKDKETTAQLNGTNYSPIIADEYQWDQWACPHNDDGNIDFNLALTGDDLKAFVDDELLILEKETLPI